MELAFREPSSASRKTTKRLKGDALNTLSTGRTPLTTHTTVRKLHMLYLDEAGKWEKPTDIREAWRIERTCLIVGKRIVGRALVGSTVNPMDKGGEEYRGLWLTLILTKKQQRKNQVWLYRIFIPAYEALEGFF